MEDLENRYVDDLKHEINKLRKEIECIKNKKEENWIDVTSRNAEPLNKLIKTVGEQIFRIKENESNFIIKSNENDLKFSIKMSIIASIIVSIVVITSGILTFLNKIDGATFTFLLGIIVGYMLTFIRRTTFPPLEEEEV